jgi:hypothetical protein
MLVGVVAACSGGDDGAEAITDGRGETTTTSTTAAPTTTTSTLPPAADGTDLGACGDGACEVEVAISALPLDIPLDGAAGIDTLTLSSITPDVIVADAVGGGGSTHLHLEMPVGHPGYLNNIGVTLVAAEGDTAIVRLAPPSPGQPGPSASGSPGVRR